jgi:hypothetical protein
MTDQKHNQYLHELRQQNAMSNLQALGVFWGGVLFLIALFALLWAPTLFKSAS